MTDQRRKNILLACMTVFILVQFFFVWNGGTHTVFNSPDANANYHFAVRIFQGLPFGVPLEGQESSAYEYLFTRSTRIVDGTVVPVGFLGLIVLYGLISKIFFINLIPYLTIIISGLAVYFFYRFLEQFFSSSVAFVAALLLMIHPAWWYYTNESLIPNVLFMSLTIIAAALCGMAMRRNVLWFSFAAGACMALALWTRSSEALWLIPFMLYVSLAIVFVERRFKILGTFWISSGMSCLLLWVVQFMVTGRIELSGYVAPVASAVAQNSSASALFPFGFHPRLILLHAFQYGIGIFWPYTILAVVSLWLLGMSFFKRTKLSFSYSVAALIVSAIVMTAYGSWQVQDSPNPSMITIGTSYVRYFLPWYVLYMIPIIAAGYVKASGYLSPKVRYGISLAALGIGIAYTYSVTMVGSSESIMAKRETLRSYDTVAGWVSEHTPSDSIVLTAKGDKYLWPQRLVITEVSRQEALDALAHFHTVEHRSVFYVGVTMDEAKRNAFNDRLGMSGLLLGDAVYSNRDVSLYQIVKKDGS